MDDLTEDDLPENHAVEYITKFLNDMDGITLATALGILEVVKFGICKTMILDEEEDDYGL